MTRPSIWRISPHKVWSLDRPRILAIINTTPDSFSDGGSITCAGDAARAAAAALANGADGLDIGGESTRPGAARISPAEQIARVLPAISAIRREVGDAPVITIDTTLSDVARAALDHGADAINDVSAATEDPAMFALASSRRCGIILMHRLAPPPADVYSHQYRDPPNYGARGIVEAVGGFLRERAAAAEQAGIAHDCIVLDPGLGFGKSVEQNLELINATPQLRALGYPILSGLSRKSFVAKSAGLDMSLPPSTRAAASVELSLQHHRAGASIFRVHDIAEHVKAFSVDSPCM